jgi:hypothetical protein
MAERFRDLTATRRIRQILTVFLCLQVLDVVSTLIGFRVGAAESSPFISALLGFGPITGLVLSKFLAISLACAALMSKRERLVRFVNFWFVAVVGWNLVIIRVASSSLN